MNTFGLDEVCMNKEYAMHIVEETHHFWKKLTNTVVSPSSHDAPKKTLSESQASVSELELPESEKIPSTIH